MLRPGTRLIDENGRSHDAKQKLRDVTSPFPRSIESIVIGNGIEEVQEETGRMDEICVWDDAGMLQDMIEADMCMMNGYKEIMSALVSRGTSKDKP